MYGHIPKPLWEKWTPADPLNRIQFACRSLFLQTDDGRNILFDVGTGNFFDPKLNNRYGVEGNFALISSLEKIGISEGDIDIIILSHLHFNDVVLFRPALGVTSLRFRFNTRSPMGPSSSYYGL